MKIGRYLQTLPDGQTQRSWCERHGFSPSLISQVANGHRRPGPNLAKRIHDATGGRVKLRELRPDIWT